MHRTPARTTARGAAEVPGRRADLHLQPQRIRAPAGVLIADGDVEGQGGADGLARRPGVARRRAVQRESGHALRLGRHLARRRRPERGQKDDGESQSAGYAPSPGFSTEIRGGGGGRLTPWTGVYQYRHRYGARPPRQTSPCGSARRPTGLHSSPRRTRHRGADSWLRRAGGRPVFGRPPAFAGPRARARHAAPPPAAPEQQKRLHAQPRRRNGRHRRGRRGRGLDHRARRQPRPAAAPGPHPDGPLHGRRLRLDAGIGDGPRLTRRQDGRRLRAGPRGARRQVDRHAGRVAVAALHRQPRPGDCPPCCRRYW